MNQQRKVIYAERRRILEGESVQEQAHKMLVDVITAYVDGATAEGYSEDWDLGALWEALKLLYPVGIDYHHLIDSDAVGEPGELTRDELLAALIEDAEFAYAVRESELTEIGGETAMRQLERSVLLTTVDRKWREHLYEMDYLKEGIGLRAMAQRDPLVEYQREGYDMFIGMLDGLKEESVGLLFNAQVQAVAPPAAQVGAHGCARGHGRVRRAGGGEGQECARQEGRRQARRRRRAAEGVARQGSRRRRRPPLTYSGPSEDGSARGAAGQRTVTGVRPRRPAEPARSAARPHASRAAATKGAQGLVAHRVSRRCGRGWPACRPRSAQR